MSLNDESSVTLSTANVNTDKLQPVYTDGTPIIWDGNDATIAGALYEVKKFFKRKNLYQTLFKNRTVPIKGGILAVDSANAAYFLTGVIPHGTFDFDKPCPPTAVRTDAWNLATTIPGTPAHNKATIAGARHLTEIPVQHKHLYQIGEHVIDAAEADLLTSLTHVFGSAEPSEELIDAADGVGTALLEALKTRSSTVSARGRALVKAKFDNVARVGVSGPLLLLPFKAFIKTYKSLKRNLPADARPSDGTEVEMITLMATKDPDLRYMYELKADTIDPKNMDEAANIVLSILRGRQLCEEIDETTVG